MNANPSSEPQAESRTGIRATRPIVSLALLLAGSLLVGFSMGRWLAPLAAWIGPALILRYARDHRGWRGYPLVLAAWILAVFIGFGAFFDPPLGVFIVLGNGFLMSLPYLADRLIVGRLKGFSSTFVFPLAAATLEFFYIRTNPVGTWGGTAFTQYGNLPLMQLASVTGTVGITFLMGWFASVANWAWETRSRGGEIRKGLAAFGAVLGVVLIFGFARLNTAPSSETVRVAGITPQSLNTLAERISAMSDPAAIQQEVLSHWEAYFDETVREAQAGAKVVVWPEVSGVADEKWGVDLPSLVARAQEIARENGIYLAVPLYTRSLDESEPYENKLLLIDPTGAIVLEHVKYGAALMEPGRLVGDGNLKTVTTPFGVLSGVICYDMDFPAVVQQSGQNGTGLMLVPSKDWAEIDPIHAHMAVFRAIENGMSLVRQTDAGLSIAVDAYGHVLAQTNYFGSTDHTMVAQIPARHVLTAYSLFGRWLDWICLVAFLALGGYVVAQAWIARRATKI
jgi:apolipoprotein N-acyltransferase